MGKGKTLLFYGALAVGFVLWGTFAMFWLWPWFIRTVGGCG